MGNFRNNQSLHVQSCIRLGIIAGFAKRTVIKGRERETEEKKTNKRNIENFERRRKLA